MNKISEYNLEDLKNAYDLVMKKENTDAIKGIKYIKRLKEDNIYDALIVSDQCSFYYYVVDRGNGLEVFDYDLDNEKILDVSYISIENRKSRNLMSDAIKKFYVDYFEAIK